MGTRGLAIVGASQSGIAWTEWLIENLVRHGYPGEIWLVNPRRETVLGRPCYPDLDALPAAPEVAALLTNADQVLVQLERLVERGCSRFLVVSNGFGELGTDDGRAREARLRELCAGRELLLVGPNGVGFALMHERLCAIAEPIAHGLVPGDVSLVSQSGGLTAAALRAVHSEGLGIDFAASLGNGAVLDIAASLEFAISRPTTRVVLGVVESLTNREALERVAARARAAGKTVALLLLGASEAGRGVAASHTGAVVSEQRTVGAWLRSLGVVTVATIEELARVASLSAILSPEDARGGFVATLSGGGAGLSADLAAHHGVPLAPPSSTTAERLRAALPPGAYVGNPLDINTGDAAAVYAALGDDPAVRFLIEPWQLPWPTESPEYHWQRAGMERLREVSRSTGLPVLIASVAHQPVSDWMREFAKGTRVWVAPDLDLTLAALGRLALPRRADDDLPGPSSSTGSGTMSRGIVAEAAARELLRAAGVPVVGGAEAADESEAERVAATLTGPFAVKLSLASVAHKERVGGVALSVPAEGVAAACGRIKANAIAAGVSDGSDVRFLVTEMVSGPELLVGVVRDPLAGLSLTVAVGGWAAEAGAVFGTIPLASSPSIADHVAAWRLPRLIGSERAEGFVGFLERLADAARTDLTDFREIELNPVMLTARGPLVVDALLVE